MREFLSFTRRTNKIFLEIYFISSVTNPVQSVIKIQTVKRRLNPPRWIVEQEYDDS